MLSAAPVQPVDVRCPGRLDQSSFYPNSHCSRFFHQHYRILTVIAIYTGFAYIAVIVALYAGWCRPFSDYLVLIPIHNSTSILDCHQAYLGLANSTVQCLSWTHYNTLQITMNLSTDLAIISVPIALFSRLKIDIRR